MAQRPLEDYILIKNCMSMCGDLLPAIKNLEWRKHTWYNNISNSNFSHDDKELNVAMAGKSLHGAFQPYIENTLTTYFNDVVSGAAIISQISEIRFNHYFVGTTMRKHIDHIHSIFDGKNKGIPVLSIIGALNDDYKGGEFVFFEDYEVKLRAGDIMIFPSNFMYPHEVKEVTEGNRYSFASWAF